MNTGFGMSAPHSLATSGAVALVPLRICPHNHRVRPHTTRPLLELWRWCRYVSDTSYPQLSLPQIPVPEIDTDNWLMIVFWCPVHHITVTAKRQNNYLQVIIAARWVRFYVEPREVQSQRWTHRGSYCHGATRIGWVIARISRAGDATTGTNKVLVAVCQHTFTHHHV